MPWGFGAQDADNYRSRLLKAAANGNTDEVKLLIEKYGDDINFQSRDGSTLLAWAALKGHDVMVELLLLKDGIDINLRNNDGRTALSLAAGKGHKNVVELLVGQDSIEVNLKDINGRTPLSWAARLGYKDVVELLVGKDGIEVNHQDPDGRTPLSLAAGSGYKHVVEVLVGQDGIDLNLQDEDGRTPLSRAADSGHKDVVELLIGQDGIDLNLQDNSGRTPLSRAADSGYKDVVELLIGQNGIDLNLQDKDGRTPLSRAADSGHKDVVELLIEQDGIEVNLQDKNGWTPLLWAAENHWHGAEVVKILLQKDDINVNLQSTIGLTPLLAAARHFSPENAGRSLEVARALLQRDDIDVNPPNGAGTAVLVEAVDAAAKAKFTTGDRWAAIEDIIQVLLQKEGINVNPKNRSGRTPLSLAAEVGDEILVKLLLQKEGIDPYLPDNDGQIPLQLAADNGHLNVVRCLANCSNHSGRTALSWAAEKGHTALVQRLLEHDDINPSARDGDGRSPLLRALENGHEAVVKLLVHHDNAAMHISVREGKQEWVKMLLDCGYEVNKRDTLDRTPLHIAALFGSSAIARLLVSFKAEVDARDADGVTPIRLAVNHRDPTSIELLLQHRADIRGIMVDEWFDAYDKKPRVWNTVLVLSEALTGEKRVHWEEVGTPLENHQRLAKPPGKERHLHVFPDNPTVTTLLGGQPVPDYTPIAVLKSMSEVEFSRLQVVGRTEVHDTYRLVRVSVHIPTCRSWNQQHFDISHWGCWQQCAIAWTMIPPASQNDGRDWKSIDHFSMLPYAWIPEDGADIFQQLILHLKANWLRICGLAEEHLARRRLEQLRAKGEDRQMIHHLVEDAQEWAKLRNILQGQVRTAREFALEYCRRYNANKGKLVQKTLDGFSDEVCSRLDQLDQTVKDLLQFEFTWVSVNEAHRSTSLATSMKRLSWITFIFLPAMFASSLFGMNVDILETNPDWRWYLLFGGGFLVLTVLGWLLFKYGQIEEWVERHIGAKLGWWGQRAAHRIRQSGSEQLLPTSGN